MKKKLVSEVKPIVNKHNIIDLLKLKSKKNIKLTQFFNYNLGHNSQVV